MSLSDSERETLYAPDRRMDGYYFSFDPTGVPEIDAILSAVAHAGKGYHHTESWSEPGDKWGRWGVGRSCIDVIQAAANDAAHRADRPPHDAEMAAARDADRVARVQGEGEAS